MRPRILYELSEQLAILLEDGLRDARGAERVPVLLCHPLDPLEDRDRLSARTVGVLYPSRITPETRLRRAGHVPVEEAPRARGSAHADIEERLLAPALWIRVRYVFLVTGGGIEEQLGAVAAALRTLHDHPYVTLSGSRSRSGDTERVSTWLEDESPETQGGARRDPRKRDPRQRDPTERDHGAEKERAESSGEAGEGAAEEQDSLPLQIVEDPSAWRELGLSEHRLTISFEVTVPIASTRSEVVSRVLERDLSLDAGRLRERPQKGDFEEGSR